SPLATRTTAPRSWRRRARCATRRLPWPKSARASQRHRNEPDVGWGIITVAYRKNRLAAQLVALAAPSILLAGAVRSADATPPRQDGALNATPAFVAPPTNTPRPTYTPPPTAIASPTPRFDVPREVVDHYVFGRPFPRDPNNVVQDFLARTYP